MSQPSNPENDYLKKLREMQEEQQKAAQTQYIPWEHLQPKPGPCPDCGSCPTCGRRGRYTITYGYPGYFYQY